MAKKKKTEWAVDDLVIVDGTLHIIESKTLTPVDGIEGFWCRCYDTGKRKARNPRDMRKPTANELA